MKKIKYRSTQGQQGTQPAGGGFLLDQPQAYIGTIASNTAASAIRTIFTAPSWNQADAIVSTLRDDEPNAQPAPRFALQSIIFTPDVTQASSAGDNPTITFERWSASGASLGSIYALNLGTTAVARATPIVIEASSFTTASNAILNVGDSIQEYISIAASAVGFVPGHLVRLDFQA